MEDGLGRHVELHLGLGLEGGLLRKFDDAEVEQLSLERGGTDEELVHGKCGFAPVGLALHPQFLVFRNGLLRESRIEDRGYGLAEVVDLAGDDDGLRRQEREDALAVLRLQFGHDEHLLLTLHRQLRLHLEGADGVDLVVEEIDAEGPLVRETVDIHDAAADGELTWFVDVVDTQESEVEERLLHIADVGLLPPAEVQRLLRHLLLRGHQFGQGLRVGYDEEEGRGSGGRGNAAEHLGAEDFVGGIALTVLHGTAERTGEEEHAVVAQDLHQVVIEVTGLLAVVGNKQIGPCQRLGSHLAKGGKRHRQARSLCTDYLHPALFGNEHPPQCLCSGVFPVEPK